MAIRLGQVVKDKISGFTGTATARTTYLFGCVWIEVTGDELSEGKPVSDWFDIQRLGIVKAVKPIKVRKSDKGGPPSAPPQRSMPKRSHPSMTDTHEGRG
jgi:hypothetical protein